MLTEKKHTHKQKNERHSNEMADLCLAVTGPRSIRLVVLWTAVHRYRGLGIEMRGFCVSLGLVGKPHSGQNEYIGVHLHTDRLQ